MTGEIRRRYCEFVNAAAGYRIRMSAEIRDWIAGLRRSDPQGAGLVGPALAALASEGESIGPPLVIPVASPPQEVELIDALDRTYRDRLERIQDVRRHIADMATLVSDMEALIASLQSQKMQLQQRRDAERNAGNSAQADAVDAEVAATTSQITDLQRLLPDVSKAERELGERQRRMQAAVDALRVRKEVMKATYTALLAESEISVVFGAWPAEGVAAAAASSASETQARLRDITAEIEREVGQVASAEGLMELRPGAPGPSGIRIIFAVEPPGTALLISVVEGLGAVLDQHREAVGLSAEILRRVRAGQDPEASECAFEDVQSLIDEFYLGEGEKILAAAQALAARNRASTLAECRMRLGLSRAKVSERMGVRLLEVVAIENGDPGTRDFDTLAKYVAALGGRLEVIADLPTERVVLR